MDFRISVCLDKFFQDERSFCYIFLDSNKYESISNLESHLCKSFDIPGDFCLMIDKYLLPSSENIRILKPGDTITVKSSSFAKRNETCYQVSCHKNNPEIDIIKEIDDLSEKDKNSKKKKKKKAKRSSQDDDDIITIADTNYPNMKAEHDTEALTSELIEEESVESKVVEKDTTMESVSFDYQAKSEMTDAAGDMNRRTKYQSDDETNNSDQEDMPLDIDGLENMIIKHIEELKKSSLVNGDKLKQINETSSGRIIKRKRIRKRKKNNIIQNMVPEVKNAMPSTSKLMIQSQKMTNHLRFDDTEKAVVQNGLANKTIDKPRIVHAIESLSSNNYLSDNIKMSLSNEQNSDKECNNIQKTLNTENCLKEKLSVEAIVANLNKYKTLDSMPLQGIVLFKMLTMGDNYLPKISNYILGQVVKSCQDALLVTMNILDGQNECIEPSGKFDLEEKKSSSSGFVEIEWKKVCEARIIYG